MSSQLFPGWEAVIAIGVIILIAGLALTASKTRGGLMLLVMGVLWLAAFGLYLALLSVGIYGKVGAEGGYIPNLIGLVLLIVGVVAGVRVARFRRT